MPHIHDSIDLTIVAYIVHANKVLLVDHRELNQWLPVGGHVHLDEDPEEALARKIKEESGLPYKLDGERPTVISSGTKNLIAPAYMDIHEISSTHRHIGMVYFASTDTDKAKLNEEDHRAIRWFSVDELSDPQYKIKPNVAYYAQQAIARLGSSS